MEDDFQIAQYCHHLFTKGEYDESIKHLRRLLEKHPSDPKILHNIAVTQYYASQTTSTDQFKDNLRRACIMADANLDDIESFSNSNQAIYYYNKAVLLFYFKQFHQALAIIEKLFVFVYDIDQRLAIQICLLLIQLYISSFQPEEAFKIIHFTDIYMFGNQNNMSNIIGSSKTSDTYPAYADISGFVKFPTNYNGVCDKSYEPYYKSILNQYKVKANIQMKNLKQCKKELKVLSSYGSNNTLYAGYFKANTEYIKGNFRKSLKIITGTLPSFQTTKDSNTNNNGLPGSDDKTMMALGSSTGDGSTFNMAPISDKPSHGRCLDNLTSKYLSCCYYNNLACNHLSLNKPNLGVFYCRKALQENESLIGEFSEHDYGPIGHTEKSWNCGKSSAIFVYDRRYQLLHNLGIHLLHARKPLPAFDCLIETIQIYHSNPRLWLRLAECCIAASRGGNEENFSLKRKLQAAVQHIMGLGIHRKTILVPGQTERTNKIGFENQQSAAMPVATLEFASICLKNAYLLLPPPSLSPPPNTADGASSNAFHFTKNPNARKSGGYNKGNSLFSPNDKGDSGHKSAGIQIDASPSNPMDADEIHVLRCSILAASAYVNLCLGEYVLALEYAESLIQELAQKGGSSIITYLAHQYCAESLILSNRVSEALLHLDTQSLTNNMQWSLRPILLQNTSSSASNSDNSEEIFGQKGNATISAQANLNRAIELPPFNWIPGDVSSARLIMHYNLCVSYTLLGEYEKASHMLRNNIPFKSTNDLPAQFIMLALYLELKQGHLEIARMIILQHFSQVQHY